MKELRQFLQKEFSKRKKRNARYSLRAFSKALKIDASTLNQILSGKRACSRAKADVLLQRLGLSTLARLAIIGPAPAFESATSVADANFKPWPKDAAKYMREWLTYAILSCFELSDFRSDAEWFARRLGVGVRNVERVLKMMERNRLIDRRAEPWTFDHASFSSNGTDERAALDFVLKSYIERSVSHLKENPGRTSGEDSVSGVTMSIAKRKLPEAIARLNAFRREFSAFLSGTETSTNDEVYRLNIQLFPLTRSERI